MSSPAVIDRPHTEEEEKTAWIELDERPVLYASQEAMRHGPRSYTARQLRVIREAVAARKPLPDTPLTLDD